MAKKDIKVQDADPEEVAAEQHVEEMMNPDYVKPAEVPAPEEAEQPAEETTDEATEEVVESTEASAEADPEEPEQPEEDIVAAVAAQQAQADGKAEPQDITAEAEAEDDTVRAEEVQTDAEITESEQTELMGDEAADQELDMATLDIVDSAETEKAVEDILRKDADAALPDMQNEPVVMKQSLGTRIRERWRAWWSNPWSRYGTLVALLGLVFALFAVQPIRALVLNTFGVRSSMLVTVFDGATNLPLKNAVVTVGESTAKTDEMGEVKLTGIRLGEQTIEISKVAFATYTKQHTFGVRIIDIGEVTLKPVGAQLTYEFTDYLSGKPVAGVELTSGESTAVSDADGRAIITLDVDASADTKITMTADGYRTDELSIPTDITSVTKHKLVPAVHAIYVSKQSGKYDVYKTYVDGKDGAVLVAGTGRERQDIVALPSPDGKFAAVASSRDDKRNDDGYLLTALNIVNVATGDMTTIDHVEYVELLGWRGTVLVYQQTVAGTSAGNPSRMKIIAYDTKNGERFQLANANSFGYSTQLIGSAVYYTSHTSTSSEDTVFAKVNTDGTSKKTLQKAAIWSLLRIEYDAMKLQTPKQWYDYRVGQSAPVTGEPSSNYVSRYYVDNPEGKLSAWVDARDSNGVLLTHNTEDSTAEDVEVTTQRSLQAPLYWLNNSTVVYRVANTNEVADYAVNIEGGDPVKIAEVSLTNIR